MTSYSQDTEVILVTGPSGAGRSTAIHALEDMGFEAIDNLPLSLVERLLVPDGTPRRLALGIDARNRDFSTAAMLQLIARLPDLPDTKSEILYLDANDDVLERRYSETRRRHPLAPQDTPAAGIAREAELLAPIRARAEMLIDTSDLSPHQLRAEITRLFGRADTPGLALSVQSFSYKRGLPSGVDLVFDLRFLRNPHWEASLRAHSGLDDAVARYVTDDPRFGPFFEKLCELVLSLLPAYVEEGKTSLGIAMGCTGGQHRSVAVAEKLAFALAEKGWRVSTRHRELERHAGMGRGTGRGSGP
ncbi:RNase adapter RapZ [Maribius pontilimi]|uniref:RNase adapter RapZ n=1 Tax=Palleronia pontilimi TaxID=1964209 RepID=A0A934MDK6_9RHOB|nr:RNase adapter RapZ [Palleronia pontilimi]MBJ3763590.1 RNase adapter RapZ [Palleronia pontilimi]